MERAELVKSLRELGLGKGDAVLLHSSLISLGHVEGGAEAVIKAITTSVSPRIPSTILKTHPDWKLFLDRDSASLLLGM